MIESILEHKAWDETAPAGGGTLTITSGSAAVVGVGTAFVADAPAGTVIVVTDDAGVLRTYQVASVTDNTNLTLEENALSAATGVSYTVITSANLTAPFFRADNSVVKKPLINISVGASRLRNSIFQSQISVDEGVLIKSIYVRLPYQYPMADTPIEIAFWYLSNSGSNLGGIAAFGSNALLLPNENIEIPVNTYVPPPTGSDTTWQLSAQILNGVANVGAAVTENWLTPQISQVDGPDVLNGLYLPVYVGARILHGFALT